MPEKPSYFDVSYAIPSNRLTVGLNVVATATADYIGIAISASAAAAKVLVYDNASGTTGAFLDVVLVAATDCQRPDRMFVVRAKNGITVDVQGAGVVATVFYTPKG